MIEARHLHLNGDTTYCGLDASYLPMTYDPAQTDCTECLVFKKIDDEIAADEVADIRRAATAEEKQRAKLEKELRHVADKRLVAEQ